MKEITPKCNHSKHWRALLDKYPNIRSLTSFIVYLEKFGYMVDNRNMIFSKLLDFALSAIIPPTAAWTGAAATAAAIARPAASVSLSPFTAPAIAVGGATFTGRVGVAFVDVLGRGRWAALSAGALLLTRDWAWVGPWFCCCCCCPGS